MLTALTPPPRRVSAVMLERSLFAGRYRIARRVGEGAMGVVYEVVDIETDRPRALKVMQANAVDRDHLRARFRAEARVTGRASSPFIVDVLNAGVDEMSGMPFLVMELLRGEDLGRRLARELRLDAAESVRLLAQAACGLDAIHRLGVVHRDLKPSNLFIEARAPEPSRVKILDFGVAKDLHAVGGHDATATAGTYTYMAPEQFRSGRITPAADLYALAMVAYALLVGVSYWDEERHANEESIAFALVAAQGPKEPARARARRQGVALPAAFDAWFTCATAFDPAERFRDARASVSALAVALGVEEPALLAEPPPGATEEVSASGDPKATATVATEGPSSAAGSTVDDTAPTSSTKTDILTAGEDLETATHSSIAPASIDTASGTRVPPMEGDRAGERPHGAAENAAPPAPLHAVPRRRAAAWALLGGLAVAMLVGAGGRRGCSALKGAARDPAALTGAASDPATLPGAALAEMAKLAPSPLADPAAVLACPQLAAFGVEEPTGWLGAAAAATFCERARVVLGGSPARTLVPAELLGLPAAPGDHYPVDPFDAAEAQRRQIAAAQRRAAAYVEGQVTWGAGGFRLALVMRRADGAEIGRAAGESRALYDAVRRAMDPLVEKGLLPTAPALDPVIADYGRARTVDDALRLLDVTLAISHNAGTLPDACSRVAERASALAEMGPGERFRCAYTLGLPAPDVALGPTDPASPGAEVTRARVTHMVRHDDAPEVISMLERAYVTETSRWGRSVTASTLSCLLQSSNPARAAEMARLAVQAEPKNPSGEWCAPWPQLVTVTQGTSGAQGAALAMQAWAPWDAYGWLREIPGRPASARARAQRAYLLSPLDTNVADALAQARITEGAREEARQIALALAEGGYPAHRVASDLLLIRVEASEARFGAALARATGAMLPAEQDAGWVRMERLDIAWWALQLGILLERSREVADQAVAAFLDPKPSPLEGAHMDVLLRLPAICAYASPEASRRCFARLHALRRRLSGGSLPGTEAFIAGAEAWALQDFAGAARAFRPLLRDPALYVAALPEAMIDTFVRVGAPEVVAALEAAAPDRARELGGASPAMVRSALRAAREGRTKEARGLAERVIAAWKTADVAVPAVEGMRRLLR